MQVASEAGGCVTPSGQCVSWIRLVEVLHRSQSLRGKFLTRHDSPLACPVIFTSEIVRVAQGEADDHVLGCAIHVARRIPRVLLQRSNSLWLRCGGKVSRRSGSIAIVSQNSMVIHGSHGHTN